jgi:hypothetical protein
MYKSSYKPYNVGFFNLSALYPLLDNPSLQLYRPRPFCGQGESNISEALPITFGYF